jgi:hypothetical protein
MWEQYGDEHRGVCLVFDQESLKATLLQELHKLGVNYDGPVRYEPAGFYGSAAQHVMDSGIFDESTRAESVARHIETYWEDFFLLKALDWATEYEYRFVLLQPDETYAFVRYGNALKAVVVGELFPGWQLPAAAEVCSAGGVELKRMRWDMGMPYPGRVDRTRAPLE